MGNLCWGCFRGLNCLGLGLNIIRAYGIQYRLLSCQKIAGSSLRPVFWSWSCCPRDTLKLNTIFLTKEMSRWYICYVIVLTEIFPHILFACSRKRKIAGNIEPDPKISPILHHALSLSNIWFYYKTRNTVSNAHTMIPPLPHVLYGKVLVLLWETPKSCG